MKAARFIFFQVLPLAFMVIVLCWNATVIGWFESPEWFRKLVFYPRFDQEWGMFAPYPFKNDGWFVVEGVLENGDTVDLFREGRPVDWHKPALVSGEYKTDRWRKYMRRLYPESDAAYSEFYLRYLCREWNESGESKVVLIRFYFMMEFTLPDHRVREPQRILVWQKVCQG